MAPLTMEHIRREGQTRDAASLNLSHRALSDITCLGGFKNLERLDLSFNCLDNLEALSSCSNLKWLCVVENKLKSLKGVEGLPKLTVLNAGRNKLRAMDEIKSITSLRALILNDNEISSICKLDELKYLNTLVLSRNPIQDVNDSLAKLTSITKLSLSYCQIETIGSSLVSCVDLKEARFAHNKIKTLPSELSRNVKLQNLDLGNNLIETWSDLKVISAMRNLKNLNLQGNPIAKEDKLARKIKKLVPSLQIFNAKPIERGDASKVTSGEDIPYHKKNDSSLYDRTDAEARRDEKKKKSKMDAKDFGENIKKIFDEDDDALPTSINLEVEKQKKKRELKRSAVDHKDNASVEMKDDDSTHDATSRKAAKRSKRKPINKEESDGEVEKEMMTKKSKTIVKDPMKNMSDREKDDSATDLKAVMESKKPVDKKGSKFDGLDDVDTPFVDLIFSDKACENSDRKKKDLEVTPAGLVVDYAKKMKKGKSLGKGLSVLGLLSQATEVGMGGASTWGD